MPKNWFQNQKLFDRLEIAQMPESKWKEVRILYNAADYKRFEKNQPATNGKPAYRVRAILPDLRYFKGEKYQDEK